MSKTNYFEVDSSINFNTLIESVQEKDPIDLYYKQNQIGEDSLKCHGRCLIFNHLGDAFRDGYRLGKLLKSTFTKLHYKCQLYENLDAFKIMDIIKKESICKYNLFSDSFILCILTNKSSEVIEYYRLSSLNLDIILDAFKGTRSKLLAGKPKIIIIQEFIDQTLKLTCDGGAKCFTSKREFRIPNHADLLIYKYSGQNSIFVEILCQKLLEKITDYNGYNQNINNEHMHLVEKLTMVTKIVREKTGITPQMFSTLLKLIKM